MRRRALLQTAAGVGVLTLPAPAMAGGSTGDRPPQEVARWDPVDHDPRWADFPEGGRMLHDVTVHDGYAYCAYWEAGVWILDVSDPARPSFVGRAGHYSYEELVALAEDDRKRSRAGLEAPGNAHYADVNDDATLLAVGAEGWDIPKTDARGPGGIALYDITDKQSPVRRARIPPPRADDESWTGTWVTAHNFELRGDRLYSSWYQGGVTVHDVSEPSAPALLAWWRAPETARFWTAQVGAPGDYFVASSFSRNGTRSALYTFPDRTGRQPDPPSLGSTSNPRPPPGEEPFEPLGVVDVEGATEAVVSTDGTTAYVATGDGFVTIDIDDPTTPERLAERRGLLTDHEGGPLEFVHDLAVDGDRLLVPGPAQGISLQGALVYDVSEPADPIQVGEFYETDYDIHNADLADGYAYLTANDLPGNPLVVVDVRSSGEDTRTTIATGTSGSSDSHTGTTGVATTGTRRSATSVADTAKPRRDGNGSRSTPGFGGVAALGGLALGTYRLVRRRTTREDDDRSGPGP